MNLSQGEVLRLSKEPDAGQMQKSLFIQAEVVTRQTDLKYKTASKRIVKNQKVQSQKSEVAILKMVECENE